MLAGPFLASKIVCLTPALPIESGIHEPALLGAKLSQHENSCGLLEFELGASADRVSDESAVIRGRMM
jgi:hypothetical protein